MELFKACLLVSSLAVFSSTSLAAPTEVVAGRVITHHSAPVVSTLHSAPLAVHSVHHAGPAVVRTLHHHAPVAIHDSLHQADLRARLRAALRANPALLHSLHQVSPGTVHTVHHHQPAVVQTFRATPTALHALHHPTPAVVETVHHAAAPAVIQAVRTSPTAVHTVHHTAPAVVQAVRTDPHAIHTLQHTAPVVTQAARAAPAVPVHVHDDGVLRTVVPAVHTLVQAEEAVNLHPQYSFGYSINDANTGDSKTRQESRDGDVVTGSYSVADPDGRIRTVTYTADSVHGFRAKVTYDGQEGPVAIPFYAPRAPLVSTTVPAAPVPLFSNVPASVPARQILSLAPGRVVAAVPASTPGDLNPSASVSRASVSEETDQSGEPEEDRY